jgi:hypothetical protein
MKKLQDEDLLLTNQNDAGVVILTIDDTYSSKIEYLIAAKDELQASAFEQRFLA